MKEQPHVTVTKYAYPNNHVIESTSYFLNGRLHREGGPAFQYWYPDGKIKLEDYIQHGKSHRIDGPAMIYYKYPVDPAAPIACVEQHSYWLYDKKYTKEEFEVIVKSIDEENIEEVVLLNTLF